MISHGEKASEKAQIYINHVGCKLVTEALRATSVILGAIKFG